VRWRMRVRPFRMTMAEMLRLTGNHLAGKASAQHQIPSQGRGRR
jgi:hypothetical protein